MDELDAGLYEELITERIRLRIEDLKSRGLESLEEPVDQIDAPDVLARHVGETIARVLEQVKGDRVSVANEFLSLARDRARDAGIVDLIESGPHELEAVFPTELHARRPYRRPQIPLGRTDLLMNARGEPSLAHEIGAELTSADRVDLLCAFVKWTGVRLLLEPLTEVLRRGVPVRVITTTYVGATERRALDELVRLGAEVRISYDTLRTRLHAKAWLFHRRSGFNTAYIGSSNLSVSAMLDGLEWNVRVSHAENSSVIDKFAAAFDGYWNDSAFEQYDPERDAQRLDEALGRSRDNKVFVLPRLDLQPYPFQQEILDRLDAERHVHDRWRNLVVAATGTGKTVVAALDYRRLRAELGGDPTLLFVAHRKEILDQTLATFRVALTDPTFGELQVAGVRPEAWRHVFASIQSLHSYGVDKIAPDHFDVVVVDEFHHAEAATYQNLLEHVRPKVLLGLTATPERADGQDITRWFDGHLAAELRVWEALDQELLCPFHYFGVADGTDLSALEWKRGGYTPAGLDGVFTGNDARANLILRQIREKVADPNTMRALGFCVSKAHAAYMARVFNEAGLPSAAIDADTPMEERLESRSRLARGDLRALFSVDVFNEGVDVPQVDTVLFLRPTESATAFLQQLGRGLRLAPDKSCVTVLDFIGQQHRSFRFDLRYRALTGSTHSTMIRQVEEGFPFLPSGCSLELDRVASATVLKSIREQLRLNATQLAKDVGSYGDLGLAEYLEQSGRDLDDIYRGGGSWTALRRAAGFPVATVGDERLLKRASRFAHVDDVARIDTWGGWLANERPPEIDELEIRDQLFARMLFFNFWIDAGGHQSYQAGLDELWHDGAARTELAELLALRRSRIHHLPIPLASPGLQHLPLQVHCRYTREELLAGLGQATLERKPKGDQMGVRYVESIAADAFTFTLQKAEREYSPSTMYKDYAISERRIHWESQNATAIESKVGQRYVHHEELATHILLFARHTRTDSIGTSPYLFLGPARYISHTGTRPIAFEWELNHPMPPDFFVQARVVAA